MMTCDLNHDLVSSPSRTATSATIIGEKDSYWKGQLARYTDPVTMLRGFLALAIIWHHLQPEPLPNFTLQGKNVFFLISFPGRISVWLFFLISGYTMYYAYRTGKYALDVRNICRFYFNRAIRILPLFYLTVLLKWLILLYSSPHGLPSSQENLKSMFFITVSMKSGIYTFTPTWVIGILVHFYVLAPFLVKAYRFVYRGLGSRVAFVALILFSLSCHYAGRWIDDSYDLRNIVACLPLFLFGFLAFDLCHERQESRPNWFMRLPAPVVFLFLLVVFEFAFYFYQYNFGAFLEKPLDVYVGLFGALLISRLILLKKKAADEERGFISRLRMGIGWFLSKAGQQSYGLYLWHGIIIVLTIQTNIVFSQISRSSIKFLLSAFLWVSVCTFFISLGAYYILEKPYHLLYQDTKGN